MVNLVNVRCGKGLVRIFGAVLLMSFLLFPAFSSAQQQTGQIVGRVIEDATGEPLVGANVFIKDSRLGAATDLEGNYRIINVPSGSYILISSFIGFYQIEQPSVSVQTGRETTVNFSLKVSALSQDEIVVTGTGYQLRKKELATAITTINVGEIQNSPVESIDQLLAGVVVGGSVNMNSGSPGTGSRMRMRGVTSAAVSQTPVIYIDGVRMDNNTNYRLGQGSGGLRSSSLSDILVNDIERIEITKGGAAATLYGSEAASGVIQIFTKKGIAGPARWNLRIDQGFNQPEKKFVIEDFTKNEFLETGKYQKYTLGVEGGSAAVTYHLSGRLLESEGVTPKNDDIQYSFRGGIRTFPSEKWQIDFSAGYVRNDYQRMYNNNAIASPMTSIEGQDADFTNTLPLSERIAKLEEFKLPELTERVNRFNFSTNINYDLHRYFTNKLILGFDYRKSEARYFNPIASEVVTSTPGGGLFRSDREYLTITLDYSGTFKYSPFDWSTSIFTFGAQGFREEDREISVDADEYGLPGTDDFDNAANLSPLESNRQIFSGGYYFNEQFGIYDKLFLNAGIRVDGNTAFGDEVDLVSYPKFGAAYNISDENFWIGSFAGNLVSQLKFRVAWGKTGSFPPPFVKDKTFGQGSYLGGVSVNFANPGESALKPEKTTTLEFGFDAAILNERVGIEFTYFTEETEDALFNVPSQPSTGLGFQIRNIGKIENKGFELGIDANVLNMDNVKFSINGSISKLDNKVTDIGGQPDFSIGGFGFLNMRVKEGFAVGTYRINKPTAAGDGEFDTVFEHSPIADKYYTLGANLTLFNNLRFRMIGDGQTGGWILNTGSVIRFFNGASPQKDKIPDGYSFGTASSVFIEDASFFKIREISASFDLPRGFFGANATLHASIRNVLTFADNTDLDPELHGVGSGRDIEVGGINFFTLSPPRQFRLGLQVQF